MQLLPDPPTKAGAIAQLGERRVCNAKVVGSIPTGSTSSAVYLQETHECDVEIALPGASCAEQSFDRTVSMSRAAL